MPSPTTSLKELQTQADQLTADGSGAAALVTLGQLLVEASIQCAEADALIGDFGSMTYADLLIRAQNIAVVLRRRDIGPGSFVGILMTQSPPAIAAIAGIILAGAAYVPIYPDLLQSTGVQKLISHSGVCLVLWDGRASTVSPFSIDLRRSGLPTLDVCRIEQDLMPSSIEAQFPAVSADAPAARIFASSTEYVTVSHRSLVRLAALAASLSLGSAETFLLEPPAHASVRHPASPRPPLFELWASLLRGSSLAIAPQADLDATEFADWIARKGVTVLSLTVSRANRFIDRSPRFLSALRCLVIENDGKTGNISPSRVAWLQQEYPLLQVVHVYSTDKTAGYATAYRVPANYEAQGDLPIGLPLEGSQARIVNELLEPVRPGEMGQLALLGDCVASFTDLNLKSEGGTDGVYLTGERARLRADGLLELHGHLEPQLVLDGRARAFESEDVEAMLAGQKHVRDAAVVTGHDRNGNTQTVAFIAMDQAHAGDASRFEGSLKELLPTAAQPSVVRYLEEMPRTADGEIDRFALEQEWKKESERSQQGDILQQEILHFVRSLWLRLLHRNFVDYEDDFFAVGGTRVQMIRMHSELNRKYPGAISMGQLAVLRTMRNVCEHLRDYVAHARRADLTRRGA